MKQHSFRTFRAEKEFGLIVGSVFMLLGLWWLYRGKFETAAYVLSAAGSALVLCGLVLPRLLTVPRRFWMKLGGDGLHLQPHHSGDHFLSCADADWTSETSDGLGSTGEAFRIA